MYTTMAYMWLVCLWAFLALSLFVFGTQNAMMGENEQDRVVQTWAMGMLWELFGIEACRILAFRMVLVTFVYHVEGTFHRMDSMACWYERRIEIFFREGHLEGDNP
ncbi:hypothetical protein CYMTET_6069 [Cymbomonas tetramitiformis]|uniref:Uncharacterized protein n=1 Tax=Cymbomonas tetramitiformis TaxID=36881 RepID=A0AAE0GXU8_9CHLO|nr:hypothetical protein CYMTET_6069 [Cymbomonas tetramitiformis]